MKPPVRSRSWLAVLAATRPGPALLAGVSAVSLLSLLLLVSLLAACGGSRASAPAPAPALGDKALCAAYGGLPAGWPKAEHAGMARIPGGAFRLGSQRGYAEERPLVPTVVDPFWIDRTEVTNAQFASFVAATGYVTVAERVAAGNAAGAGAASGSVVFDPQGAAAGPGGWWRLVPGADWRHPDGPGSSLAGRASEPVVDLGYADAEAYARWLGRALPSEAQWEFAAKAGRDDAASDRALRDARGRPQANTWQGVFPVLDQAADGHAGRAPVGCYAANPRGLFDMVGNVWEWTQDPWREDHTPGAGPASLAARDAAMPSGRGTARRVIKGGSYLCSADYCVRARASSRQAEEEDLPTVHLGFRTVAAAT